MQMTVLITFPVRSFGLAVVSNVLAYLQSPSLLLHSSMANDQDHGQFEVSLGSIELQSLCLLRFSQV